MRKDKGFSGRFTRWQQQSLDTSFRRQDTDIVITQRLCVFFHIEVTAHLANQALRTEAYQIQDEDLESQHHHLAGDYAEIFSGHQYPSYIGDISTCLHLVQEAARQSLSERRRHIARILKTLQAENTAGNALLLRLQPYLPDPVPLQRRFTATRPGLRRSDLDTSLSSKPLRRTIYPLIPGFQNPGPWTFAAGGGGASYQEAFPPSPDILPPPPLTIPISPPSPKPTYLDVYPSSPVNTPPSPDPTHLEAYPTSPSNYTSTLIDTFITNPLTLSGTFSITLTLDPLPLPQSPDRYEDDYGSDDPHARTDYEYGLTDLPDDEGDLLRDLYALQTQYGWDEDLYDSQGSPSLDELPVWVERTDYHMCLTDVPDDEGDLSRDLYALQTNHAEDSEGNASEDQYSYSDNYGGGERGDSPEDEASRSTSGGDTSADERSDPYAYPYTDSPPDSPRSASPDPDPYPYAYHFDGGSDSDSDY